MDLFWKLSYWWLVGNLTIFAFLLWRYDDQSSMRTTVTELGVTAMLTTCLVSLLTVFCGHSQPGAKIIQVPPAVSAEERERREIEDRLWQEYCQPKLRYGEYGVRYYVYAKPGCEFGRNSD